MLFISLSRKEAYTVHCSDNVINGMRVQGAKRILDAPGIRNDYYVNVMSWGKNNILAVALGPELYLWNSKDQSVHKLLHVRGNDCPTSVNWSEDAKTLAVGYMCSNLQLWDAESFKLV